MLNYGHYNNASGKATKGREKARDTTIKFSRA